MNTEVTLTAEQLWKIIIDSTAQRIEEYGSDGYSDPALCLYEIETAGMHIAFNLTTTPFTSSIILDQMDPLIRGARQMNNDAARKAFRTLVAKYELTNARK